jgi:hypothetical protein
MKRGAAPLAGIGHSASKRITTVKECEVAMSSSNRPDVTDEEIGMRTYQIRKARAVERALERMRQGLQAEWSKFTEPEIEMVSWILGELWAYIPHSEWDELHFGLLSVTDVRKTLNLAREMVNHSRNSVDVLKEVQAIVVSKG